MCTYLDLLSDVGSDKEGASVELVHRSVATLEVEEVVEDARVEGRAHLLPLSGALPAMTRCQVVSHAGKVKWGDVRPRTAFHRRGALQDLRDGGGGQHDL